MQSRISAIVTPDIGYCNILGRALRSKLELLRSLSSILWQLDVGGCSCSCLGVASELHHDKQRSFFMAA